MDSGLAWKATVRPQKGRKHAGYLRFIWIDLKFRRGMGLVAHL